MNSADREIRYDTLGRRITITAHRLTWASRQHIDTDWMDDAACVGLPWEDFFGSAIPGTGKEDYGMERKLPGLAVCTECPVRQQCLDYAQHHRIQYGIWGGMTSKARATLRRKPLEGR